MMKIFLCSILVLFVASVSHAGEAHILDVKIEPTDEDHFTVWATVQHDDEGWDHYADRWEILDMDGTVLDTRVLLHPHSRVPFTRSLPRAKIPAGTKEIRVRAHDSVHGYGGKEMVVSVP